MSVSNALKEIKEMTQVNKKTKDCFIAARPPSPPSHLFEGDGDCIFELNKIRG